MTTRFPLSEDADERRIATQHEDDAVAEASNRLAADPSLPELADILHDADTRREVGTTHRER